MHIEATAPILLDRVLNSLSQSDMENMVLKVINPIRKDQLRARALRDSFLTQMDDDELDEVFSVWSKPEVTELINEVGEIENPIPLGLKMLREVPEFRSLAKRAVKAVLWG